MCGRALVRNDVKSKKFKNSFPLFELDNRIDFALEYQAISGAGAAILYQVSSNWDSSLPPRER